MDFPELPSLYGSELGLTTRVRVDYKSPVRYGGCKRRSSWSRVNSGSWSRVPDSTMVYMQSANSQEWDLVDSWGHGGITAHNSVDAQPCPLTSDATMSTFTSESGLRGQPSLSSSLRWLKITEMAKFSGMCLPWERKICFCENKESYIFVTLFEGGRAH